MKIHSEEESTQPVISAPPEIPGSVASMSPEYPKYRDALIISIVIVILITVLAGGYFFVKGTDTDFRKFTKDPVKHLTNLINGYETYKICQLFISHNERLFRELGRDVRFSLVKEEIRIFKGEKRATVIIKAQGRTDTKNVVFQLNKQKGKWRILYVGLELRNGEYKTLYPRQRS